MNWVFLSLLAPLFWVSSNFVDKFILEKYSRGIFDFLFFSTITCWFFAVAIFSFVGFPQLSWHSLIPIATGMTLVYSYGFYGKALEQSDTSSLVILFKLTPVITVFLAFIFLNQTLSLQEIIAFITIFLGTLIVSVEKNKRIFTSGLGMILVAMLMWSLMTLFIDHGLTKMTFWEYFMLDNFGSALAGLTLFLIPRVRRQVVEGIKNADFKKYAWFSLNNLLDFFGQMSIKKALAIAPSAGLVMVVTQVQSFYAILIGICLTIFFPNFIKENISAANVARKTIGATVMFFGVYLILV